MVIRNHLDSADDDSRDRRSLSRPSPFGFTTM
jgi:hypothetical protein